MGLGVTNKVIPLSKYKWKAFLETTSTRSDWYVRISGHNSDIYWKVIDKVNGSVISQGIHPKNTYDIQIDLTKNINGAILYLKVDNTGNMVNNCTMWYYDHELNWVDIDVLPELKTFWIGYNNSQYVEIKNDRGINNINNSYHYTNKFKNINFINNSEAFITLNVYGDTVLENNQLINATKWKNTLNYLRLESANVGYDTFDFSDFNVLERLEFYKHFNLQNSNGTEILLPKNTLKYLNTYNVNVLFTQFGVDALPALYYLSIRGNVADYDYNNITNNGDKFPALIYFYNNYNRILYPDLTISNFPKLERYTQYGGTDTNNGELIIWNNPKFWYPYFFGVPYTNIQLDEISQQSIKNCVYVYPKTSLDLSKASLLEYIRYSNRQEPGLKLNIRNGNNSNLTYFNISKYYNDSCIICDDDCFDSNGNLALPIMVNADKRDGDYFTTDPNDANCPT